MSNVEEKIRNVWMIDFFLGKRMKVSDLYKFSKIKLKRKRMRKKFEKHYTRYLSEEVIKVYWGCLMSELASNTFKSVSGLNLPVVEPIDGLPKGEIVYLDYEYKKQ